jgi:hypothetical protein
VQLETQLETQGSGTFKLCANIQAAHVGARGRALPAPAARTGCQCTVTAVAWAWAIDSEVIDRSESAESGGVTIHVSVNLNLRDAGRGQTVTRRRWLRLEGGCGLKLQYHGDHRVMLTHWHCQWHPCGCRGGWCGGGCV